MATMTVIYPSGGKFDMDYYLSKHMPLVYENWSPDGLKSWKVLEFDSSEPFCVQATLEFSSLEDFKKASSGPKASTILGDIPNFSDKEPLILAGAIKGTS